ncbi:unnamed protein product [Penicillium nalgiovense]|uniref:Microbial-type PARG catalytic domain-containing protein n=1 Tax=Penicillium nalgiovense TaxID=60175 RepID=A0A1V6ZA43_PENNA|nr:hypothetical protein PENNAL_c0001G12116 [Penicillium nalgiovense]CAG7963754.1 unnamed protein product [Penicillium nalgiovense]CAG7993046.1 unnamed protein product [Penicillium nalgiovense]CAG8023904.1 unnamed protein product [Penicillium nalgiovense]CAG8066857.1 unnamed protein product [Penicillium nalgiovense]
MPKRKLSVQSNTSGSTNSRQSLRSQYANQSPARTTNSHSSSGLTRVMSTIHEKFTSDTTQKASLDGEPMDPGPKKRRLMGKMGDVIATTKEATIEILAKTELEGTRFGYIANKWTASVLDSKSVDYPNLRAAVRVVAGDTYDRALEMREAGSDTDHMPVCVLNFANAYNPGGGWLNGARAQEEQLCYRSTLIDTLHTRFYPMGDLECLYSPNVIVFRNSVDKEYSFMSADDKLHQNPTVSVISMAARNKPALVKADGLTYKDESQRHLMIAKMQLILRTAAHNNHRRLVLGALGCGAFRHPAQEVADCWYEVLMKEEFKGWFETIYFVIRDSPAENNLQVFQETLDALLIT